MIPAKPANEQQRLATLRGYEILTRIRTVKKLRRPIESGAMIVNPTGRRANSFSVTHDLRRVRIIG
jgi:hypothetical protein